MPRELGRVKWFNDSKGFGFIEADKDSANIFVHFTALEVDGFRSVAENERVSFERVDGPKGATAMAVRKVIEKLSEKETTEDKLSKKVNKLCLKIEKTKNSIRDQIEKLELQLTELYQLTEKD